MILVLYGAFRRLRGLDASRVTEFSQTLLVPSSSANILVTFGKIAIIFTLLRIRGSTAPWKFRGFLYGICLITVLSSTTALLGQFLECGILLKRQCLPSRVAERLALAITCEVCQNRRESRQLIDS